MENTKALYNKLKNRLLRTRSLYYINNFVWGLLLSIIIFQISVLLFSILEHFGHFQSEVRLVFYLLIWFSLIIPFGLFAVKDLLRAFGFAGAMDTITIALQIGNFYEDVKDRLSNSLQLFQLASNSRGTSIQLALQSFSDTYNSTQSKNFNIIIDKRKNFIIAIYLLLTSTILLSGFSFFDSSIGSGFNRIQNWKMSFVPPAPFSLEINPKYAKILINTDIRIQVKAFGTSPETLKLFIKENTSKEFDSFTLRLDTNNTYNFVFTNVTNSFEYYAVANWLNTEVNTDIGRVIVYEKPFIRSLNGNVIFPSYTKYEPRQLNEQNADITALVGSNANFTITSNKNLKSAEIVIVNRLQNDTLASTDTTIVPMKINKNTAYGNFRIFNNGFYYFRILDSLNEENTQPVNYGIIALQDEYPSITMVQPAYNVKLNEDGILPMIVNITDDYGFSNLYLYYRLSYSQYTTPDKEFTKISIPILQTGNSIDVPYVWNLMNLDIVPEDRFEFFVEVADNDIVKGPKTARTQLLTAVLPSLEEVLAESENVQESIQKDMEQVIKQSNELQKDIEQFERELKQDPNKGQMNWEQQKQAQDLMKKQNDLKNKMENLEKQLSKNTENLKDNNLLSEETLQKFMELQKLMKEVDSPALKKLQQQMQQAMQKLSKEDMEKALKDFKFNEEQFKKSIERTLNILKRLQLEQKIDATNRKAEKMQDQQEELSNKLKDKNLTKEEKDQIAKKQEQLKKDVEQAEKDLKEIEKMMQQFPKDPMPMNELKEAQEALDANNTQQEMDEAMQEMQSGKQQKSQQSMQNAQKKLANFKSKMQKLKDEMDKQSSEEAIRQMQKAISDLLKLSKDQENLLNKTQNTDGSSSTIPELGRQQMGQFDATMKLAERMMELGERSFAVTPEMANQIAEALQEMNNALENFTDRKMNQIAQSQQKALGNMNNAIGQMQQMLQAMKQSNGTCPNPGGSGEPNSMSPGGQGMGEKLQQLAAQQQALSQMMQQMQQGQGQGQVGGMSPEQQAQYQRIMKNQQEAQKTMQQLQDEAKKFGNTPEGKKLQSDLEKIKKEMDETMSEMRQNGIRPETVKKQERILAKLLDLMSSENERDKENRREAKEGKNFNVQSPDEIDFTTQEGQKALMEQMLKQSEKQYSVDYQRLIKQYFESLNKSNKE